MSLTKKIARNTIIQISGKIISTFLGLLTIALMTRYLGQEGFGYYTTVMAFLMFFAILIDFGLNLTTIQLISQPDADQNKIVSNIFTFRLISSAIFLSIAPLIIWLFPYSIAVKWGVLITVFSYFFTTLIQVLTGVFQKELKMFKVALAEVFGRIVLFGLTGLSVYLNLGIYWIFVAITLGSLVNFILVYFFSKKYVSLKFSFDKKVWKKVWKTTWPIALSIAFNLIYLKMDIIILSLTRTVEEVGLYGATYRVVDILTILPTMFMGLILPLIAKYWAEKNTQTLKNIFQKSFNVLVMVALPIVFGTMIIAKPLMVLVAGSDFALSGGILKILILASGTIFITALFGHAVVGVNKQKIMIWGYLTVAVLTMIGYLIFIPRFGYYGAAWMTVFSEILIMVWTIVLVSRTIKFFPSLKVALKSLVASLIMVAVLYLFKDFHVLILLVVAFAVYFPTLYLLKGFDRKIISEVLGS